MPAEAGIQSWIPASAGMTTYKFNSEKITQ